MKSDKAKLIKQIAATCRKEHFDYEDIKYIFRRVREELEVRPARKSKALPDIMTDEELKQFFSTIDKVNIIHSILFRLMYYTGMRISELCNVRLADIDIEACKIKVVQGKGSKDRTVLYPETFKLTLKTYIAGLSKQTYLFESAQYKQFTPRRIQQLFKRYKTNAGITKDLTPHSLRHQCLTYLTSKGLTDSQIQLVSGHSSKDVLSIYQHLSLNHVEGNYQEAFSK
ncbi:MAG: hypothetical protein A2X43_14065 [Candidatus Margulisbacteria bacterium GWD2_39_127]|nr:MAG: hypothetical protein A2X43_14065 [Candidatus Margulisbacteria bacterium GWD2_39_127]